jgi:hypothetical protein
MGTAVKTARTSPASWDAFSDVDAFVDDVPVEIAAMETDGTKPTRLSKEWGRCARQAMTGRMFQRLGNEDEVGFAPGRNWDRGVEP